MAVGYSPQLRQAREVRRRAGYEVRRAEAGYLPTIGVWAGGGVMQGDDMSTRATGEHRDVVGTGTTGLTFSQTLWQGGATEAMVRSRSAAFEAQTHLLTDSATLLVFNAVSCHADVIRRRRLLELAAANIKEHEKILGLIRARFVQGISSRGEVEQVRSRLSRAQATWLTHNSGLEAALANYVRITGRPAPTRLRPVPPPRHVYASADEARAESVRHNPRIMAEIADIRAALGEKDYARSAFFPRLSLDAGPSYTDWGRKGSSYQWTWNAMLNLHWDFYNGGADTAAFRAAAAKAREARMALHVHMDALDEEIRVTYSRAEDTARQREHYAAAKQASRESGRNFFEQFQAGQRNLLDVLDAASEYFYAAVEECVSATDSVLGRYRLLALSGRLLEEMGIDARRLHGPVPQNPDDSSWDFLKPSPTLDVEEVMGRSILRGGGRAGS